MYPTKYTYPLLGLEWLQWYDLHKVYHPGIDLGTSGNSDLGQEIVAPKSGFVDIVYTGSNHRGFGKFIIIQHDDGNYTRYAHLNSVEVKEKAQVKEGQKIATLGNTGTVSPHLHFEVFRESMAEIQRKHWYTWRYYPSGKTKQYITEHYINPWEWLKPVQESKEFSDAWKKMLARKIYSESTDKYSEVNTSTLAVFFDRFFDVIVEEMTKIIKTK